MGSTKANGVPHSVLEVEGDIALIVTLAAALTLKRLLPNTMALFILQPALALQQLVLPIATVRIIRVPALPAMMLR
jgi:hypothetical protein